MHLTQTEFIILALLTQHAGELLTYAAMNEAIWGAADPGGNRKLQVNMANLRRKLGIRPGDNRYIVNELASAIICNRTRKRAARLPPEHMINPSD